VEATGLMDAFERIEVEAGDQRRDEVLLHANEPAVHSGRPGRCRWWCGGETTLFGGVHTNSAARRERAVGWRAGVAGCGIPPHAPRRPKVARGRVASWRRRIRNSPARPGAEQDAEVGAIHRSIAIEIGPRIGAAPRGEQHAEIGAIDVAVTIDVGPRLALRIA